MKISSEKIRGIREFQRIRRYLSAIYLYGFLSRRDFGESNNGSAKNYDVAISIIRQLFPEQKDIDSKRSAHFIRRSYHRSGEDYVANAYLFRSMDHQYEMNEYLAALSELRAGDAYPRDLMAAIDNLGIYRDDGEPDVHVPKKKQRDPKIVGRRMTTLSQYGVVQKKKNTYSLCCDPLMELAMLQKNLTDQELLQLVDYVRFSACVTYPRVAGSFLLRSLEEELLRRGIQPQEDSPFLLRHNTNHNSLDEELIYQLRPLMREHRFVLFDSQLRLPVKLRVDTRLGRWYVLCTDSHGNPCIQKITNTSTITAAPDHMFAPDDLWNQALDTVDEVFAHSLTSGELGVPVVVRVRLCFPESLPGLRRQFLREMPMGRCEGELFEAVVSDPMELKPFLRAFGPYIRVEPGDHTLPHVLRQDYEKMLHALDTGVPV